MGRLWLTALGLGLAGLDPAGALLAIAALASGARARHVIAFGAAVPVGTALLGAGCRSPRAGSSPTSTGLCSFRPGGSARYWKSWSA